MFKEKIDPTNELTMVLLIDMPSVSCVDENFHDYYMI